MGAGMSSENSLVNAGFLRERLQRAAAVPVGERTPEVAGFVESCRLRDEAAALLAQPLPPTASAAERDRLALQVSLRLVKADHLSAGAPLDFYNKAKTWAVQQVHEMASTHITTAGLWRFTRVEGAILELLASMGKQAGQPGSEPRLLGPLLLITAALEPPPVVSALPVVGRLLQLLLQPQVQGSLDAQLQQVQRSMPAPVLSRDELVGRVAEHALQCCMFASKTPFVPSKQAVPFLACLRQAVLPQLAAAPGQPPVAALRLRWAAACAAFLLNHSAQANWVPKAALLGPMRQAGSDYYVALAGFSLRLSVTPMVKEATLPPDSPAAVLGWVWQAEAAYQRCKRVLPSVWLANIRDRRGAALAACPWLESLAAACNTWAAAPPAEAVEAVARGLEFNTQLATNPNSAKLACAACGATALQLRTCGSCRSAGYCSKSCQEQHWPQHRRECKAAKQARAARGTGSSAGTGSLGASPPVGSTGAVGSIVGIAGVGGTAVSTGAGRGLAAKQPAVGSAGTVGSPADSGLPGWLIAGWLAAAGAIIWMAGWRLFGWMLAASLVKHCLLASTGWLAGKNRQ